MQSYKDCSLLDFNRILVCKNSELRNFPNHLFILFIYLFFFNFILFFFIQFNVPFKIFSAHLRRANQRLGENGRTPRKTTLHTRKQNLACLTCGRGARAHTRHNGGMIDPDHCLLVPFQMLYKLSTETILITMCAHVAFFCNQMFMVQSA